MLGLAPPRTSTDPRTSTTRWNCPCWQTKRQRCAQRHISGVPLQVLKYRWEHKKRKKIGKSGNGKQPPWQEPPLMIRSSEQA